MTVTVQFFSFFRQLVGGSERQVELPSQATVADAFAQFPQLRDAKRSTLIAVGMDFANWDTALREGDVVSFMPPLQGGSDDELLITDQPIGDPGPVATDVGAVVVFWGVVRGQEDGQPIRALDYTAYGAMAEHQLRKLLADCRQRWPLKRIRVVHRLGVVPVGEPSLLVRVEAGHRQEAFAAAQFIIDELKQKVPIWKRGV